MEACSPWRADHACFTRTHTQTLGRLAHQEDRTGRVHLKGNVLHTRTSCITSTQCQACLTREENHRWLKSVERTPATSVLPTLFSGHRPRPLEHLGTLFWILSIRVTPMAAPQCVEDSQLLHAHADTQTHGRFAHPDSMTTWRLCPRIKERTRAP